MIKHFFAQMSEDWRISPRVLNIGTIDTVLENDEGKGLIEPSIVSFSMKKILSIARKSCFVLKLKKC